MKKIINIKQNKMNKNRRSTYSLQIIITLFLIIILLTSFVSAAETTPTASAGTADTSGQTSSQTTSVGLGKDADFSKYDEATRKRLDALNRYAQANWEQKEGSYGNVEIKDGGMTVTNTDGEFAKLPKGYENVFDPNNPKKFTTKNNDAAADSTLEIKGNKFKTENGAEVSYSVDDFGKQTIELKGKGDIQIGEKTIEGIEDAKFTTDKDNKIISQTFKSTNGGKYEIETRTGRITADLQKGGEVSWNEETKEVSGKNIEIKFPDGSVLSTKGFSGKSDKDGNLLSLSTDGFSKYTDKNKNIFFGDDLKIYNDRTNPDSVTGNAIFFGDKNAITLKGIVQANNGKGLNYNGYNEKTIAQYNPNTNNFDVKGGDAKISNGENTFEVNDGKVTLKRENLVSEKNSESFTARYQDETGKILTTTIDKASGNLYLSSIKDGKTTETAIIPLSEFEGGLNNVKALQESYTEQLQKNLDELISSGASRDKIDTIELAIANAQNRNDYTSNAINRIMNYLDSDRTSKSEFNAKLALAELYAKRAANPEIPIGTSLLDWEKTSRTLSAKDYQASIGLYKSIKEGASDNQLRDAAGFGLAEVYRNSGDIRSATSEYNNLINTGSSKQTISNAEMGIAQLHLDNNDIRRSLISLDEALSTDPNNLKALQLKESITNGVYENIQKGLGNQLNEFAKDYEAKLGLGNYKSLTETPGAALKAAFLNTGNVVWNSLGRTDGGITATFQGKQYEISQAQLGTSVYQQIRSQGYSDTEFAQLDFNDKKDIIAKTYGLSYIDENKLRDAFIEANKGTIAATPNSGYFDEQGYLDRYNSERDNFIKKLYGEETLRQDKLVYDMTSAATEAKQKISDLDKITDPKKYSDLTSSDFKFKTGEGYIDPEGLKLTWKDSVLKQVNLVNAALVLAPGATVTVAGRTMTVTGWAATGARTIPGVEAGIGGINAARITASEALGLRAVAETFPKTSSVVGWVGEQTGYFAASDAVARAVPYGEYVAPFIGPLGTERQIARELEVGGISTKLEGFLMDRAAEKIGGLTPLHVLEKGETLDSVAQRLSKRGILENPSIYGDIPGTKRFTLNSENFLVSETPLVLRSPEPGIPKPVSNNAMLDVKFGSSVVSGRDLTTFDSMRYAESQADIAALRELYPSAKFYRNPAMGYGQSTTPTSSAASTWNKDRIYARIVSDAEYKQIRSTGMIIPSESGELIPTIDAQNKKVLNRLSLMSGNQLKDYYQNVLGGNGANKRIIFFTTNTAPIQDGIRVRGVSDIREAKFSGGKINLID